MNELVIQTHLYITLQPLGTLSSCLHTQFWTFTHTSFQVRSATTHDWIFVW